MLASTPQGSILSPALYNIFTSDFPTDNNITVCLFADDAAILCTRNTVEEAINLTQNYIYKLELWLTKWRQRNDQHSKITFEISPIYPPYASQRILSHSKLLKRRETPLQKFLVVTSATPLSTSSIEELSFPLPVSPRVELPLSCQVWIQRKKCTGAVFLDIQKAFDRVWHTGLLYKLIKINAPPQLILIIKSFLNNRSFAVRVNDTHSSTKQIRAGAPQAHSSPHPIQHLHQRHSKNTTNDSLPLRRRYCDPHTEHEQKLHYSLSPQAPGRARGLVQKMENFH
ncbi:hypothetical protein TNCV_4511401 [Trichonephila clavipes]|nr:hypothetical protein TNCV_4511401 [Trichonephila clavipes]